MNIRTRLKPVSLMLALSFGLAVPVTTSMAAGSDWMNDYFNSAGAGMNVTPADVYQSQGQTTMSLGGFSYRAPQRATNLFSFSPPGYKAGCGGIDAWLGAYGFVNMDAFVAALRNIGQNAVGYFFQLALKTMAPEIDGLLTDLSKTMNGLNQLQLSSCQSMKQYVGTPPDTKNMDLEQRASVFGSALTGTYGSFFGAKEDNKTSPTVTQKNYDDACALSSVLCRDKVSGALILQADTNLVFEALNRTGAYTKEEIELYISLLGTTVLTKNNSDQASGFDIQYFEPTLTWKGFLGGTAPGTLDMTIRECPNALCLHDAVTGSLVTRTTTGMTAIVFEQLNKIRDAIVTRAPLTDPKALQVMAMTSIPIYQMIAQSINSGRGSTVVTDQLINSFSEAVGIEFAYRQLLDIQRQVTDSFTKMATVAIKSDQTSIADMKTHMQEVVQAADQEFNVAQKTVADKMASISMMMDFQRQMYTSMGPRLTANVEFDRR
jgi:conjugative transfer pilus assembly protein TraH